MALTTTTTTFFLLLILSSSISSSSSSPIIGLDTFLSHQSRLDPQATNDSFLSLSSSLKSSLSLSSTSLLSLSDKTHSLLSLSISLSLRVCLVGDSFPSSASSLLDSFLSASQHSDHFHVITPFDSLLHQLAVKHSLHLDVSHSPSLASLLSKALKSEIDKTPSSLRSPLLSIPQVEAERG